MTNPLADAWIPHQLTPEQREEYEERMAILQYDAGLEPLAADFEARRICKERWKTEKETHEDK